MYTIVGDTPWANFINGHDSTITAMNEKMRGFHGKLVTLSPERPTASITASGGFTLQHNYAPVAQWIE